MTLRLRKLHATGNDFLVVLDLDDRWRALSPALRRALCDRHVGVGADGLIRIGPPNAGGDCSMDLVNADGGPAEMSGNGMRCLAWVAADAGLGRRDGLAVDTATGRRDVTLVRDSAGEVRSATVDMGAVTFDPARIPVDAPSPFDLSVNVAGSMHTGDAAGMGNPHFVIFVDDPEAAAVDMLGPVIEHDPRFVHRTNVEFVAVDGDGLRVRIWERGVGETLSCGTGACAAAAVAQRRGLVGDDLIVRVPGGDLAVHLGATIELGGPVVHVFDVEVDPDRVARSAGLREELA